MKPKQYTDAELLQAAEQGFNWKKNKAQVALLDEIADPGLAPERLRAIFEQNGDNIRLSVLTHPRCPVDLLEAVQVTMKESKGPRSA